MSIQMAAFRLLQNGKINIHEFLELMPDLETRYQQTIVPIKNELEFMAPQYEGVLWNAIS